MPRPGSAPRRSWACAAAEPGRSSMRGSPQLRTPTFPTAQIPHWPCRSSSRRSGFLPKDGRSITLRATSLRSRGGCWPSRRTPRRRERAFRISAHILELAIRTTNPASERLELVFGAELGYRRGGLDPNATAVFAQAAPFSSSPTAAPTPGAKRLPSRRPSTCSAFARKRRSRGCGCAARTSPTCVPARSSTISLGRCSARPSTSSRRAGPCRNEGYALQRIEHAVDAPIDGLGGEGARSSPDG